MSSFPAQQRHLLAAEAVLHLLPRLLVIPQTHPPRAPPLLPPPDSSAGAPGGIGGGGKRGAEKTQIGFSSFDLHFFTDWREDQEQRRICTPTVAVIASAPSDGTPPFLFSLVSANAATSVRAPRSEQRARWEDAEPERNKAGREN